MLNLDNFSAAIALTYDAAIDVDRWSDALAAFCRLFKSPKGQIAFATSIQDSHSFFRFYGFSDADLRAVPRYRELIPRDPRISSIRFKAVHCRQTVSSEVLHASQMYKEALVPARVEYAMWFFIDLDEHSGCALSVMRGPKDEPFTEQDCAEFSRFVPHIQRALTMHGTFQRFRQEVAASREVIDSVPLGVLVVSDNGVLLANQVARALLAEGNAVSFHNGKLHAAGAAADAQLTLAIREARDGVRSPVGITIPIGKDDTTSIGRDHEIKALIRPLNPSSADLLGISTLAVALYLSDSRKPVETPEETLQQLFGLSGREATVLHALVQGDNLRAIGKRLGIEHPTVKTHLQNIMRATGVNRQAELVQTVLNSPAWISFQKNGIASDRARLSHSVLDPLA